MSASATASTEGNLPYAHLHVHTEYSMLDGAARLKDLFKEVKSLGMTHVAMTDHGNLYGADPVLAAHLGLTRQWLHAVRLSFEHPTAGHEVTFESPYPDDLAGALDILRAES